MKNIIKLLILSLFVTAAVTGCGDSDDPNVISGEPGNFVNNNNQGIRVLLSLADLAALFPAPVNPQGAVVDPAIVEFRIFAFDSADNIVAQGTVPAGQDISLLLTGLQLTQFDIVVAGVDANGDLVSAVGADQIAPLNNDLVVIGREVFNALIGFILPDDGNDPPVGNTDINVTVTEVEGEYEVAFDGGNARSVSAIPVDLVNALANDPTNTELQTRLLGEALTITGTSGDPLSSPVVLTADQTIPGVVINQSFMGFTGVQYRVTVDRLNGDTGFQDIVLTARGDT